MTQPAPLPFETTTEIIRNAIQDLVEQERHQLVPAFSPTNDFLLSAALVSRTWRSIAQPALLRNGLVTPGGREGFLEQLNQRGMTATTSTVRFGAGGRLARDEVTEDDAEGTDDWESLVELVENLPALDKLEVTGAGLVFLSSARLAARGVSHIVLVNQTFQNGIAVLTHFTSSPPTRLAVFGALARDREELSMAEAATVLSATFVSVTHLDVRSRQLRWQLCGAFVRTGAIPAPRLESFHLQTPNPITITVTHKLHWGSHPYFFLPSPTSPLIFACFPTPRFLDLLLP